MSSGGSRDEREARVRRLNRGLGRETSFFDQAVADRLGLALADVTCIDLIAETGPLTAGRLAELTGLTTGSTTRMIDRLEQAGYVRRVADPADRRRVLVEEVPERQQQLAALHRSLNEAQSREFVQFTDAELETVARYLERAVAILADEARKMRQVEPAAGTEGGSFAAPMTGIASARLVFLSGAPAVRVSSGAGLRELYRASFEGSVPRVRVRGGVVTVAYPRFAWFDWRASVAGQNLQASVHWQRNRGYIALNPGVPWAIELRGGATSIDMDLAGLRLSAFELRGGAGRVSLKLPGPAGIVPILINGGTSHVTVLRPPGAAARLEVRGGASHVTVDGERMKGAGALSLRSPGAGESADRFEIVIAGGASHVTIGTA